MILRDESFSDDISLNSVRVYNLAGDLTKITVHPFILRIFTNTPDVYR